MSSPKTQNPKRKFETEASSSSSSTSSYSFKTHQQLVKTKTETWAFLDTILSQIDKLRDVESELSGQVDFWEENQYRVGTAAFLAKRRENFAAVSLGFDERRDDLNGKVLDGVDVSEESLQLLHECMREILDFPNRGEIAEQNTCALTMALDDNVDEQEFLGPRVIRMIHKVRMIAAAEDSLLLSLQEQVRAGYKVLVQEQVRADVASATDTPAISSPKSYFKTLLKETTKGWATLNDLMKQGELLRRRVAEKERRLNNVQHELASCSPNIRGRFYDNLKRIEIRRSLLRHKHRVEPFVDISRKCLSLVQQCLSMDSDRLLQVERESMKEELEGFLGEIYEEQLEVQLKLSHQIDVVRGLLSKEGLLLNRLEQQVREEHSDRGVFLS